MPVYVCVSSLQHIKMLLTFVSLKLPKIGTGNYQKQKKKMATNYLRIMTASKEGMEN